MDNKKIIDALNGMLSQEHACAIRYATHAAVISGPYAETVKARLKEISGDEVTHAEKLRDRITALGGEPTLQVKAGDLIPAFDLDRILKVNIGEELAAIKSYTEILKNIPADNAILFLTIQEIIRDEQEHLEELKNLEQKNA